jgi:hypothetical protein
MKIAIRSTKEMIRHVLYTIGGRNLILMIKIIRKTPSDHLNGQNNERRFTTIYENKIWESIDNGSVSGPGSSIQSTQELVLNLSSVLRKLNVKRIVDIGCGDFSWMKSVEGEFHYTGIAIFEDVILKLNNEFASNHRVFIHADASVDDIPIGDAAICREILFHLSFADIWRILRNLSRHGYIYLIATSDRNTWFNANIISGDHRPLNLQKSPFKFPEPIYHVFDNKISAERIIGVWKFDELLLD